MRPGIINERTLIIINSSKNISQWESFIPNSQKNITKNKPEIGYRQPPVLTIIPNLPKVKSSPPHERNDQTKTDHLSSNPIKKEHHSNSSSKYGSDRKRSKEIQIEREKKNDSMSDVEPINTKGLTMSPSTMLSKMLIPLTPLISPCSSDPQFVDNLFNSKPEKPSLELSVEKPTLDDKKVEEVKKEEIKKEEIKTTDKDKKKREREESNTKSKTESNDERSSKRHHRDKTSSHIKQEDNHDELDDKKKKRKESNGEKEKSEKKKRQR